MQFSKNFRQLQSVFPQQQKSKGNRKDWWYVKHKANIDKHTELWGAAKLVGGVLIFLKFWREKTLIRRFKGIPSMFTIEEILDFCVFYKCMTYPMHK